MKRIRKAKEVKETTGKTVKDVIGFLSNFDENSIVTSGDGGIYVDSPHNDCGNNCDDCKCNHDIPIIDDDKVDININNRPCSIRECAETVYGCDISNINNNGVPSIFTKEEIENDNTAMTHINKRGTKTYYPSNFEICLPEPCKSNIMVERRNNTHLVEALLEIEDEACKIMDDLDREYNKIKNDIHIAKQAKIYETLAEYNTQTNMHATAAIMCTIASEYPKD